MQQLRNMISKIGGLVSSLFGDLFDGISDGIDDGDIGMVARNVTALMLVISLFLIFGFIFIKLLLRNSVFVVITAFLIAGVYGAYKKLLGIEDAVEPKIIKPTKEDYDSIGLTVKSALKSVASALGLAPIHGYTDITLDAEDMIMEWGKVWRLGYGTLKKTAGSVLDLDLCERVIQAQIKTTLYRENPSGFSEVRFPWGGKLVPVIQVDEVRQDDAYIYVMVVLASDTYFKQKSHLENQRTMLMTGTDTDDPDF